MIKIVVLCGVLCCLQMSLGYVSKGRNTTTETEKTPSDDNNANKTIESISNTKVSQTNKSYIEEKKIDENNKLDKKLEIEKNQNGDEKSVKKLDEKAQEEAKTTEKVENKDLNKELKKEAVKDGDMNVDMGDELDAMLHNGETHVHGGGGEVEKDEKGGEIRNGESGEKGNMNMGDEIEEMMHEGEIHVHSGKHRSFLASNSTSLYGTAEQEDLLHGGDKDVHSKHNIEEKPESVEQIIGSADPEMALHEGRKHEEEGDTEAGGQHEAEGDSDVGTELEALLHGDDGHAHDRPKKEEVGDGRKFVANDPEHLMHGEHGIHDEDREEEVSEEDLRSRNLQFSPQNVEGEVGSITKEDFIDYQEWRKTRNVGKKNWMSGFSYISDTFRQNIEAIKQRYLSKLFSNKNSGESSRTMHDEG